MLSRTAESLFWAARYLQRAENTARLLEVGYRMSMIPSTDGGYVNEWSSILASASVSEAFGQFYDSITVENVQNFLIFDDRNPSSIKSCIRSARENARAARTALTSEVWEEINYSYLRFQEIEAQRLNRLSLPELCDWVKRRSSAMYGAFENTQIQGEGYDFFKLGYYLERADNTARLLDVKYYVLLPTIDAIGGGVDTFQWFALLRALSAIRSFHWVYKGDYTTQKIADFLILNTTCTRSLLHCAEKVTFHLGRLSRTHKRKTKAHSYADNLVEELASWEIEDIIIHGLHEFLREFMHKNAQMTDEISQSFLFGNV